MTFNSTIQSELERENLKLDILNENLQTIKILKPQFEKTDIMLAISSGVFCGIIDIFLVNEPQKSPDWEIVDQFARL